MGRQRQTPEPRNIMKLQSLMTNIRDCNLRGVQKIKKKKKKVPISISPLDNAKLSKKLAELFRRLVAIFCTLRKNYNMTRTAVMTPVCANELSVLIVLHQRN